MAKAIWNGVILAENDKYEMVEGNVYLPPDSVKWQYLTKVDLRATSPSLGEATLYDVEVKGKVIQNGAQSYPEPKEAAKQIKDYIVFAYREIQVQTERGG